MITDASPPLLPRASQWDKQQKTAIRVQPTPGRPKLVRFCFSFTVKFEKLESYHKREKKILKEKKLQ